MSISMKKLMWVILVVVMVQPAFGGSDMISSNVVEEGRTIYNRSCLVCHGAFGKGDGPAAFFNAAYSASRARDFTVGNYKFRSTVSGSLPLDQDLFRIITTGIPGYMPSFAGLSSEQRWQVVAYIKTFYPGFQDEIPEVMEIASVPIPASPESVQRGKVLFQEMDCHSCHGAQARGYGQVALAGELKDGTGLPISPNDLTNSSGWKNGDTARDVVRTLLTGLDGTPMPSYESQLVGHEENAWHLANYLLSLSGRN